MYFRAIATDLDGTLAVGDRTNREALAALDELRADGVATLLVTGRVQDELDMVFPGLSSHFDAVVTENGAVLHTRSGTRALASPVDVELEKSLAESGVPCRRGRVLLACDGQHTATVAAAVQTLGLDCQLVHNRDALMVLPAGVSKGRGLFIALGELRLSHHNTIAVGDAENDLSLLQTAEVGVAVGDAVPSLRDHADLVMDAPDGAGVSALAHGPLFTGQQRLCPRRWWVKVGVCDDGTPALLPGSQASMLISGASGTGKSHLAGLLVERWVQAGYSVLVIDPEGDHGSLNDLPAVLRIDAAEHQPRPAELVAMLRQRFSSVVLDLLGLSPQDKARYIRELPAAIDAARLECGLPHWVVVDEAQLPVEDALGPSWLGLPGRGLCLVTYRPDQLTDPVRTGMDFAVHLTSTSARTAGRQAILVDSAGQRRFRVDARRTRHVRHLHKYAAAQLPAGKRFYFDDDQSPPSGNVVEFARALRRLPRPVLSYHATRGDFSRWLAGTVQDATLAETVAGIEHEFTARAATNVEAVRDALVAAVESRYTDEQ